MPMERKSNAARSVNDSIICEAIQQRPCLCSYVQLEEAVLSFCVQGEWDTAPMASIALKSSQDWTHDRCRYFHSQQVQHLPLSVLLEWLKSQLCRTSWITTLILYNYCWNLLADGLTIMFLLQSNNVLKIQNPIICG